MKSLMKQSNAFLMKHWKHIILGFLVILMLYNSLVLWTRSSKSDVENFEIKEIETLVSKIQNKIKDLDDVNDAIVKFGEDVK